MHYSKSATRNQVKVQSFLNSFHGDSEINWRLIKGKNAFSKHGTFNEMSTELQRYNDDRYNVYFVTNGGGNHDQDINRITSLWIDMDAGRINGNYLAIDDVNKKKQSFMSLIAAFPATPSYIVETRNGYHAYWLVDDCQISDFTSYQKRLIKHFNSDKAIHNLSRVMRVPGFMWTKTDEQFLCSVVGGNGLRYKVSEIACLLPEIIVTNNKAKDAVPLTSVKAKPTVTVDNIELIKRLDVNGMINRLTVRGGFAWSIVGNTLPQQVNNLESRNSMDVVDLQENKWTDRLCDYDSSEPYTLNYRSHKASMNKIVNNRAEMYEFIDSINLVDFLGLTDSKHCCLFHFDRNPSASIFTTASGHYLYKCHSDCDKTWGIIQIVEKLAKCSKPKAIRFICDVYGIQIIETEYQKEQKEMLQTNKELLESGKMELYPNLYKAIKRYIPLLIIMHDIAQQYVYDNPYDGADENMISFFASIRYIAELCGNSGNIKRISDRLNLMSYCEVIEKLTKDKVPENQWNAAIENSCKFKDDTLKQDRRQVNFYGLTSYTDDILSRADEYAKLFFERCGTMKGWSHEYLIRTFGQEIADRVYPGMVWIMKDGTRYDNMTNKKTNKYSEQFVTALMSCLDTYGYATERQVTELIPGYRDMNAIRTKRILQEVLSSYSLKRLRLNKQLKETYHVTDIGYGGYIIVKKQ